MCSAGHADIMRRRDRPGWSCRHFIPRGTSEEYRVGKYTLRVKEELVQVYENDEPVFPIKLKQLATPENRHYMAKSLGLTAEEVNRIAAVVLEDHPLHRVKAPKVKEEVEGEIPDEVEAQVEQILGIEDPIEFIGDTIQLVHKGDREMAQLLWLGTLSPELGYGLHTTVVGSTDVGKSDLVRKVLRCVPDEYRVKLDGSSSKALYYAVKAGIAVDGVAFNFDDVQTSEEMLHLLKIMSTDDPEALKYWTVDEDRKFAELLVPRKFVVFASTIQSLTDAQGQLLRRYIVINPEESPEALKQAMEHIKEEVRAGKTEVTYPPEFQVAQALTRVIKRADYRVVIPFNFEFPAPDFAAKTALKKFAALVWCITKARFKQRLAIGKTLLAQPEDFDLAAKLWAHRQPLKVDEIAMQVLNELDDQEPEEHYSSEENLKYWTPPPKTSTTIARDLKFAPRTVREKLDNLYSAGLADRKIIGGRGNPYAYWKSPTISPITAAPEMLPQIDPNTLLSTSIDYFAKIPVEEKEKISNFQNTIEEYRKRLEKYLTSRSDSCCNNHPSKPDTSVEQKEPPTSAPPCTAKSSSSKSARICEKAG